MPPAPTDSDPALVVRLHREVVDTPAPRRPLSPAQALHLASEGPHERASVAPGDGPEIEIVLPADVDTDTGSIG